MKHMQVAATKNSAATANVFADPSSTIAA